MQKKHIMRYVLAITSISAIHFAIYTIMPGNWGGAIIVSICALWILLPSNGSTMKSDQPLDIDALTYKELAQSLDVEDMDIEEQELHSALGTVFNTMAQNATKDLYSSEITATCDLAKKPANTSKVDENGSHGSFEQSRAEKCFDRRDGNSTAEIFDELDFYAAGASNQFDVSLRVDPDGKLHYIFQENESGSGEIKPREEALSEEYQQKRMQTSEQRNEITVDKQLRNLGDLYKMKTQSDKIGQNQDLIHSLIDHLERLEIIISAIIDADELVTAEKILNPFIGLLLDWLLENCGLLDSNKPSSIMIEMGRKVSLPDREELQVNMLSNYLGKLVTVIRFLASGDSFNWLTELYDVVSGIKTSFQDWETECLQAIRVETASFLGECVKVLLSPESVERGNSDNSRQSGEMEV